MNNLTPTSESFIFHQPLLELAEVVPQGLQVGGYHVCA
jgi:hypothetical protein